METCSFSSSHPETRNPATDTLGSSKISSPCFYTFPDTTRKAAQVYWIWNFSMWRDRHSSSYCVGRQQTRVIPRMPSSSTRPFNWGKFNTLPWRIWKRERERERERKEEKGERTWRNLTRDRKTPEKLLTRNPWLSGFQCTIHLLCKSIEATEWD